jgi:hypothetical protein
MSRRLDIRTYSVTHYERHLVMQHAFDLYPSRSHLPFKQLLWDACLSCRYAKGGSRLHHDLVGSSNSLSTRSSGNAALLPNIQPQLLTRICLRGSMNAVSHDVAQTAVHEGTLC